MASTKPASDIRLELWNELVERVLKPLMHSSVFTVHGHYSLSTHMLKKLNGVELYPFIHAHVVEFVRKHFEDDILSKYSNLKHADLVLAACFADFKHFSIVAKRLTEIISPLERAYLQDGNRETLNPTMQKLFKGAFRETIFRKFADSLRHSVFRCISNDFRILMPYTVKKFVEFIETISDAQETFCENDWNIHVRENLIEKMRHSPLSKETHLKEFMNCAQRLSILMEFVFIRSSGENERIIEQQLAEIRDHRLFGNDAEKLRDMLFQDGEEIENGRFIRFFQDDEAFLQRISRHASGLFSELVHGNARIDAMVFPEEQNIFHRLVRQRARMQNLCTEGNVESKIIYEVFMTPLSDIIGNTWPKPEDMLTVMIEYCESHFSSTDPRKRRPGVTMNDLGVTLGLSLFVPSAHAFPEFFRILLSKQLLYGATLPALKMEDLPPDPTFTERASIIQYISTMFDDAGQWWKYQNEISSTVESFQQKHGQICFELRIVRRSLWNLSPDAGLVLPPKLRALSESVEQSLQSSYPMRCIPIHSVAGQITITTSLWSFLGRDVKIKLTTAQCCVLVQFEETKELSLGDIAKLVLTDNRNPSGFMAVVAIVKSMMGIHPILRKQPPNPHFHENDVVLLNRQFKPRSRSTVLPIPEYLHDSPKSTKAAVQAVLKKYHLLLLKASLMSILKQEREMELGRLKTMVYSNICNRYDGNVVSFEDLVEQLQADDFLIVDKNIARYLE